MEIPRKKVLVVESDEVIVVLISHILTRSSYVVHTSLDALEAGDLLLRNDYDAILMDLRMPNGGVDLIRRIEERNPELVKKIIIVTGALDELHKLNGLPLYAIVRKPFEIGDLLDKVRGCVTPAD